MLRRETGKVCSGSRWRNGGIRMKWNRFTLLEADGALFCGLAAPLLFMAYRWSGGAVWAALLASVNHSAWELTKLLLVPFALWAVILFLADRPPIKRYTVAQAAGLTASAAGMLLFCHVLSCIMGDCTPVAALLAVFVFSTAGHWLAVKIYQSKRRLVGWFTVALFLLILLVVMVLSFTVNPPQIRLFLDPITNTYGIPQINT